MGAEDEVRCSSTLAARKIKFPRKIFGDSNSMEPVSVPRKLRSAIKKRSCESTSAALPDSKRLHYPAIGVEEPRKHCLKKSYTSMNGCLSKIPERAIPAPISKDEEEVAETLFALAAMIPLNETRKKNKMDDRSSEEKALNLAQNNEDPLLASKDTMTLKEKPQASFGTASDGVANASENAERSPAHSIQMKSLVGPADLGLPKLSERRQAYPSLKVLVPPVNLQAIPPLLRTCDQRTSTNPSFFHTSIEPSQSNGLNNKHEKAVFPHGDSYSITGVADVVTSKDRQCAPSIDRSLTSRPLHAYGVDGFPLQSSAVIFPSWLNGATSSSKLGTCKDTVMTEKASCSNNGSSNSWKRCAAHVYISRLIQVSQMSEEKETKPLDANQLRSSQCFEGGYPKLDRSSNVLGELNGLFTANCMFDTAAGKNAHEAVNRLPVNVQLHQEQEEGPSSSGCCGSNKQSAKFLSMPSGGGSAADNIASRLRNNHESGGKRQMYYLHSVPQQAVQIHLPMPPNHISPNGYRDQVAPQSVGRSPSSPQIHLQAPPYLGNHVVPVHTDRLVAPAEKTGSKQQQHIWAAQLAAQFKPSPFLSSYISNWQNGRHDQQPSAYRMQALLSPSQPSLEALGAKYIHISQQQPTLNGLGPSFPTANSKLQQGQVSSLCEDSGGRFRPDSVLPLQLLCSEKL